MTNTDRIYVERRDVAGHLVTRIRVADNHSAQVIRGQMLARGDGHTVQITGQELPRTMAKPAPVTEGMYRMDGKIYKVQRAVHGSGHLYAKELDLVATNVNGQTVTDWIIRKGMVAKLNQSHRMTLAEARAFGSLYGVCVRCGAQLTDEASIARGMGPVCATKI